VAHSRERDIAISLAAGLLARERRTTRALVKAERATLAALRAAVAPVVGRAALAVAQGRVDRGDAMAVVRRTVPTLRDAVDHALIASRRRARILGRESLVLPAHAAPASDEQDAAASHTTAGSYAAAWGAAAMATILARDETNEGSLAKGFSHAPLDYRLRRIAATESASAFNDERARGMRATHDPEAGVFKVWSAVLDRRTCGLCFDKDGRTIELHASFGETPPVHVCCRCAIEFVHVPRPERLEDVAFDYALFKREMRDVIRERRVAGERHATGFVRGSMDRARSPVQVTKKFRALAP
jgi:hypothetical protein